MFLYHLNDLSNCKKILRKNVTYNSIKCRKKPGFHPLDDTFFEIPQEVQIDPQPFKGQKVDTQIQRCANHPLQSK